MKISWFDASEAQEFGKTLALFFIERIPLQTTLKKEKLYQKQQEVIAKVFTQIAKFKQDHSLNIYKKAKLGNAFKWELKNAGYNADFIDQLTHEIMIKL